MVGTLYTLLGICSMFCLPGFFFLTCILFVLSSVSPKLSTFQFHNNYISYIRILKYRKIRENIAVHKRCILNLKKKYSHSIGFTSSASVDHLFSNLFILAGFILEGITYENAFLILRLTPAWCPIASASQLHDLFAWY